MYDNPTGPIAAGGSTGALALTGTNSLWFALAAFALVALGTAMLRISPRKAGRADIKSEHWR